MDKLLKKARHISGLAWYERATRRLVGRKLAWRVPGEQEHAKWRDYRRRMGQVLRELRSMEMRKGWGR
jgi:hypothetical protein